MDKIIDKSLQIKEYLLTLDEVKEYMEIKKAYEEDNSLRLLKRDLLRAKNENRMDDYKILKEKYDHHPLVINFNESKNNVASLLKEMSNIINL